MQIHFGAVRRKGGAALGWKGRPPLNRNCAKPREKCTRGKAGVEEEECEIRRDMYEMSSFIFPTVTPYSLTEYRLELKWDFSRASSMIHAVGENSTKLPGS